MSYPFNVIEKKYDFENGDKYVIETKQCIHCKNPGTVEIFTQELFYLHQGMHVQDAVKSLDADSREQMITGTHPKCWIKMFGEEEE
tara:strand:+ start:443 stop:700 length:258 start_codon:yes stop_codon:yes gene_type:complete